MKNKDQIIHIARRTIEIESKAIADLQNYVDEAFVKSVEIIFHSSGRLIITGIGKSANIATKMVATFNSTGTPSIFLHAADAIHGDLGMIRKDDVIISLSKSGNTPEIKVLIPMLKSMGTTLIGMVGNMESYLAKQADVAICTHVQKEACPNNLAPTSSTTAQLVMGDALAVALLECRGFTQNDFAKLHPGGALGKQLYLKVADLYIHNEKPQVDINEEVKDIIVEISSKRLGAAAVMDDNNIVGVITDGDIRRMLQHHSNLSDLTAKDIMTKNPKTIGKNVLAVDALVMMRKNNITQLLVEEEEEYLGVVHLHDLLKEGIF